MTDVAGKTTAVVKTNPFALLLKDRQRSIEELLPSHMSFKRFAHILLQNVIKNPDLQRCSKISLANAVLQAAQLGLEPGGALQHAHLIPFKTECQLIVDYKGYVELAHRSGKVNKIDAEVVRAGDDFDYELGTNEFLRHKPLRNGERGEMTHAWAMVTLANGAKKFIVMDAIQVAHVKAHSPARDKKDAPWNTDPEEMWKKTAVKRLRKMIPQSPEMAKAAELDDAAELGQRQAFDIELEPIEGEPAGAVESAVASEKAADRTADLKNRVAEQRKATKEPTVTSETIPESAEFTEDDYRAKLGTLMPRDPAMVTGVLRQMVEGFASLDDIPATSDGRIAVLDTIEERLVKAGK